MQIHGLLLPALLLTSLAQNGVTSYTTAPENCPITLPTATSFVPPYPHRPLAPFSNRFWYGTDDLWAMPSADGIWRGTVSPQGVFDKVFWWSIRWDWQTDHRPELSVTVRPLDGSVPPVTMVGATNAHNKDDIQHAMLVGIRIPAPGCWELTGEYKGKSLSYVIWLPQPITR